MSLKEIRKASLKYHKRAQKVNWLKVVNTLPKVKKNGY